MENLHTGDCIRTSTGLFIDVFNPTPEMICIEDIAHALSHQPRFGGHLPVFYSVAQHSLWCSFHAPMNLAMEALMHDAAEAYMLDFPKPIKKRFPEYKVVENNLMRVIAEKFGFTFPMSKEVKQIDIIALEWEHKAFFIEGGRDRDLLPPVLVREAFLDRFNILNKLNK